jgi:hypothetical protein
LFFKYYSILQEDNMPYKFERKYGTAATVNFTLWEIDGVDVNATASAVLGDVVIYKNTGGDATSVSANTTNLFSAHQSGAWTSLVLTNTEMEAARITVQIIDSHNSPKEWLDEFLYIETYGQLSAQHEHTGYQLSANTISSISESILGYDWNDVAVVSDRSLLNAARFLRNRWKVSGSALSVFQEDDSTTAWTVALDTVTSAAPVIDFNPD